MPVEMSPELQEAVEEVKTLINEGFSPNQVKANLKDVGFSDEEVNTIMSNASVALIKAIPQPAPAKKAPAPAPKPAAPKEAEAPTEVATAAELPIEAEVEPDLDIIPGLESDDELTGLLLSDESGEDIEDATRDILEPEGPILPKSAAPAPPPPPPPSKELPAPGEGLTPPPSISPEDQDKQRESKGMILLLVMAANIGLLVALILDKMGIVDLPF